jgi:hypothetical protein
MALGGTLGDSCFYGRLLHTVSMMRLQVVEQVDRCKSNQNERISPAQKITRCKPHLGSSTWTSRSSEVSSEKELKATLPKKIEFNRVEPKRFASYACTSSQRYYPIG